MDELARRRDSVRQWFETASMDIGSMAAAPPPFSLRVPLIVMGVSGSGKTTLGEAIAARTGLSFFDGDTFHSPAARAKMTAGVALTDEDRAPWLDRIGEFLADSAAHPDGAIVACSALKRTYRDRLRAAVGPSLRFVFLEGDKALMRDRVADRKGHFMPASLIDSQFATLEPPDGEGDVVTLDAGKDVARLAGEVVERLGGTTGG
jgi:gluconokinase